MQNLKNKLAGLGFIGLVSFALLPAGLTVCGPATAKILRHAKKIHPVAHNHGPGLKAMQQYARVLVSDVLPEENRELRNLAGDDAAARNGAHLRSDGSEAAWAARAWVTPKIPIHLLQSVLNL